MKAFALLLFAAALPAQVPQMPEVPVDVVVTDQSNAPVHGLAASDFHLFEDGKEQAIAGHQPGPKPIAFLFGPQSSESRKWIQQAAAKFAAANAGPVHPVVIVFTDACYNTSVTPVSSDPDQIQAMLQQWPEQQKCDHPGDFGGLAAAAYYAQVAESLAQVPGHKTAILFLPVATAAAPAESSRSRNRKEAAAETQHDPFDMKHEFRKADASVYPLAVQAGAAVPAWALDLAHATGGHPLTRDQDGPDLLDRIARERAEAYTLIFKPKISAEGSCHELKVAVDRPDVKVFGRNLYCNIPEVTAAAAPPKKTGVETATDASVSVPFFYDPDGMARVDMALDIPSPRLEPIERNGEVHAELQLLGLAYVPGGTVAAQFTRKCTFDFETREQFDAFLKRPLHCEHQFKLVFRFSKDSLGTAEAPLAIDLPRKDQLNLSAIALSRDVRPISPEAAEDEAELDQAPLIFRGNRISVSGADILPRTGIAEAYFEVYPPPSTGSTAPHLTMRLRLLDEATGTEAWNSGDFDLSSLAKAGDRIVAVAVRLPVAKLPAGNYRAELKVTDGTGAGATRTVSFRTE